MSAPASGPTTPTARSYAVLVTPVANRAFAGAAPRLLAAEVAAVGRGPLGGRLRDVAVLELAGVAYVGLTSEGPLEGDDLRAVAALSTAHALFERRGRPGEDEALVPVRLPARDRYDDDLVTIPKYVGKTNEHVTRLLLNLTTAALEAPVGAPGRVPARRLRLLDPLAGRGTTLSLGLLADMDVTGVEVDAGEVDAHRAFLTRWLRTKRLKHSVQAERLRVAGRTLGTRLRVSLSPTKEAARAGDVQTLELLGADTAAVGPVLAAGSFDLLVTDAPYGVQHGSSRAGGGLARSPRELLERALPVWVPLLRRGGALGIAWNTHVLPRAELRALLEANGLEVLPAGEDGELAHRVDQAVHRDLLVARRPRRGAGSGAAPASDGSPPRRAG
ncbi:hypothetical protein [uncultured Pseudokineococcus sp.]|uniref:hypothetical protein n=1 Tax=uncultured Pseudokineococcus sp. TaxID=1642928 RepID=UPI0026023711|nr:hypothetical protein [uncultured Pseudokineococcus sp.]